MGGINSTHGIPYKVISLSYCYWRKNITSLWWFPKITPNQCALLDNGDWQEFGKKLTCKRDFSNILPTVLRLMLKDPFKQSVRTRWRSGIHSGGLVGFRFRPLFKLEEYQMNGHHHCQQEFKGKTSGKLFSVLTSDLSSKKDFPPHICEPIYFSKIPPSPQWLIYF